MEIGKIPPHDIEAEQAILGSMLTDQDAVVDAIEEYCDGDFAYYQKNISDHLPIVMTVQI